MLFLRRLAKWLAILAAVAVAFAVAFVWVVLGVNPLEGDADQLWELVSNDVQFFVRFPGTQVLRSELAQGLEEEPGYEFLFDVREQLEDLTRQVAREVNPNVPLGLVDVDFERDFLASEMAVAGTFGPDYSRPRLDSFLLLTRIAWYGRFVSALQADFVRSRIPAADRIELVKGTYFRYVLDDETARRLTQLRAQRGGRGPLREVYFGRIKDVLLVSDEPMWIEAAVRGGQQTLKADPWFETEFIRRSRAQDVELFLRHSLTAHMMMQHGNPERGGPLAPLSWILPWSMAGDVTVQASLRADGASMRLSNNPTPEGYAKVTQEHLQNLYEREKADLKFDLSENGIGRLIPRRRTVGAAVFHADPEDLVGFILASMAPYDRDNMNDQVRGASRAGRRYRDLRDLLRELTKDLEGTHLVVIHRPSVFGQASYSSYKDRADPPTPKGQFTFTLVSRVKDSVAPDKVRESLFRHLEHLGLDSKGSHQSGKFHLAEPKVETGDFPLLKPAYGALPEMKYVLIAYDVEGAEAVLEAAENPEERLINDPGFQGAVRQLPSRGSLALVVRGDLLRQSLGDRVREEARDFLDTPGKQTEWRRQYDEANRKLPPEQRRSDEEITRDIVARTERYIAEMYPEFRETYENSLAWLGAVDTAVLTCNLGIGPQKQVHARAFVLFRTGGGESAPE
ncbi:MAG: hypothetical protein ACYTEZ_19910 [Planctomycetota bacterium]|jgi:ketosteroid isomerase-like protein